VNNPTNEEAKDFILAVKANLHGYRLPDGQSVFFHTPSMVPLLRGRIPLWLTPYGLHYVGGGLWFSP
ncbi:MAG: hypothetical protein KC643_32195, partial [Nitrospira sp.]|nr:hypothetical protein [Nitrospira sp.]